MEKKTSSDIGNLFADDPIFTRRVRDSKGRFATQERAAYDKARKENTFLRYQVERYKRLAEKAEPTISALFKITKRQGDTLAKHRKELAKKQK